MDQGRVRGQLLTEGAAHQQVAGVGHQGHHRHLPVPRPGAHQGEHRVLPGGGVVGQALHHSLESAEAGVPGGDAQSEGHGEVPQGDGHPIPDAPAETGLVAFHGNILRFQVRLSLYPF